MDEPQILYRDDKIRAAMAVRKLTDQELAHQTGLGRATVAQIRDGARDTKLTTLKKIADALALEMGELFESREGEEAV